jgi:hypothetical protein
MARRQRKANKGLLSTLFGLINPVKDPSLIIAIILTIFAKSNTSDPLQWLLFGALAWMAVKAFIWLLLNLAFSFVYLIRKTGWVLRHPRLALRLLDALGTEEIIIGGLRPDMFATEAGGLHLGNLGIGGGGGGYEQYPEPYESLTRPPQFSQRLDAQAEELQQLLAAYSRMIGDWYVHTEEKWRAVSDSQLGWKPLRGRWNSWVEIFSDAYGVDGVSSVTQADPLMRRFENAQAKGSAASSVACFLHDMEELRRGLVQLEGEDGAALPRSGPMSQQMPISQRTGKSSAIIRNPRIVDAD